MIKNTNSVIDEDNFIEVMGEYLSKCDTPEEKEELKQKFFQIEQLEDIEKIGDNYLKRKVNYVND